MFNIRITENDKIIIMTSVPGKCEARNTCTSNGFICNARDYCSHINYAGCILSLVWNVACQWFLCYVHTRSKQVTGRSVWRLEQKWKWTSGEISKLNVEMATLILWNVMLIIWINRLNQKIQNYNRSFSSNSVYLKFNSVIDSVP